MKEKVSARQKLQNKITGECCLSCSGPKETNKYLGFSGTQSFLKRKPGHSTHIKRRHFEQTQTT
jgi:hypothetical protein